MQLSVHLPKTNQKSHCGHWVLLFLLCCTLIMLISSCCWIVQYSLFFALHCTYCVHFWLWTTHMILSWVVDPTDHYTFWSWSAWSIWMCHYIHCPAVYSTLVKWSNSVIHISLCIVKHLCFCLYFRPCPKFHTIISYTCFELKPKASGGTKKERVWESNHISECTDPFSSSLRVVEVVHN